MPTERHDCSGHKSLHADDTAQCQPGHGDQADLAGAIAATSELTETAVGERKNTCALTDADRSFYLQQSSPSNDLLYADWLEAYQRGKTKCPGDIGDADLPSDDLAALALYRCAVNCCRHLRPRLETFATV
jgi:hypothetical protein